jgi:hypothetical protein
MDSTRSTSSRCASCGHVLRRHGTYWTDDTYGPCRQSGCRCIGWVAAVGDCPHSRRQLGWGDEVRCLDCGSTLYVIDN